MPFHIDALEQNTKNSVGRNYSDGLNWTWNNTITYMDTFAEKHNLTVLAGFTAERYADWWLNGSRPGVSRTSDLASYRILFHHRSHHHLGVGRRYVVEVFLVLLVIDERAQTRECPLLVLWLIAGLGTFYKNLLDQGRITDHRINYTVYNLAAFMNGEISECIDRLTIAENAEKLKASEL